MLWSWQGLLVEWILGDEGSRRVLTVLASAMEKVGTFAKMGQTVRKIRFEKDNQGFCFHQVNFNIPISHWGDRWWSCEYRSTRFQEQAKTETRELNNTYRAFSFFFKPLRLDEITKENVWIEQELGPRQSRDPCQDLEVEYNRSLYGS